ncbi:MAG TPA: hypothetical protein VGE32_01580, partial [Cellvibrio sp.]
RQIDNDPTTFIVETLIILPIQSRRAAKSDNKPTTFIVGSLTSATDCNELKRIHCSYQHRSASRNAKELVLQRFWAMLAASHSIKCNELKRSATD